MAPIISIAIKPADGRVNIGTQIETIKPRALSTFKAPMIYIVDSDNP